MDCVAALYQAPELQREEFHVCGRHSDMWAVGCMVMELCSGSDLDPQWANLGRKTDAEVTEFQARERAAIGVVDGWIDAILTHTLQVYVYKATVSLSMQSAFQSCLLLLCTKAHCGAWVDVSVVVSPK